MDRRAAQDNLVNHHVVGLRLYVEQENAGDVSRDGNAIVPLCYVRAGFVLSDHLSWECDTMGGGTRKGI